LNLINFLLPISNLTIDQRETPCRIDSSASIAMQISFYEHIANHAVGEE